MNAYNCCLQAKPTQIFVILGTTERLTMCTQPRGNTDTQHLLSAGPQHMV